jgi:hypothetical protein
MGKELKIPLPNGGTLRCGRGDKCQWGGYVRICDKRGKELFYWDVEEWETKGEGESVMGAIFSAAVST